MSTATPTAQPTNSSTGNEAIIRTSVRVIQYAFEAKPSGLGNITDAPGGEDVGIRALILVQVWTQGLGTSAGLVGNMGNKYVQIGSAETYVESAPSGVLACTNAVGGAG